MEEIIRKHDTLGEYSYTDTASTYNGTRRLKGQVNIKGIPVDVDYGDQKLDVITKIDPKTIGFEYSLNGEGKTFTDNKFKEVVRLYSEKMSEKITDIKKKSEENDKERDSKGFIFKILSGTMNAGGGSRAFTQVVQNEIQGSFQAGIISSIAGNNPVVQLALQTALNRELAKPGHRGSYFQRSDLGQLHNTINPLNFIGYTWAATNYVTGALTGQNPSIHRVPGGYVVTGGGLMGRGDGITIGQFATVGGHSAGTVRHESAHIQQYNEWGPERYFSNLGISPINNLFGGNHTLVAENNADYRAGTYSGYGNSQRDFDYTFYRIILDPTKNWNQIITEYMELLSLGRLGYVP